MTKKVTGSARFGHFLAYGAPYFYLGQVEIKILSYLIGALLIPKLFPIPRSLDGETHYKHGKSEHESTTKKIIGSIILKEHPTLEDLLR